MTQTRFVLAQRHLFGTGSEFGALHQPLEVDRSKCQVVYADRLDKATALAKFPELRSIAGDIVEPEIIIDLEADELATLRDREFDFIVANHMIEHLVNPIRWLQSIAFAMKPGALLYLAVPDKERTFDVNRELTQQEPADLHECS